MTDDQSVPAGGEPHDPIPDRIPLTDPGKVVAALPHLLGFYPADSLVLLAQEGDAIGVTLRVDLLDAHHDRRVAAGLADELARHDPTLVVCVVVGDDLDGTGVGARAPLAAHLAAELGAYGVHTHVYGVPRVAPGERWFVYGATGRVPDSYGSLMHALSVSRGLVVQPSREALAATLAPDPDETLARRARLINEFLDARNARDTPDDIEAAYQAVRRQVDRAVDRVEPLTDAEIVELGVALADSWVRDRCMALAIGERAGAAERLWTDLVRALPAPECAQPASLLAVFAYIRGDGPVASFALDHALDADPDHRLATLVNQALEQGVPPQAMRGLAQRCAGLRHTTTTTDTAAAGTGDDPTSSNTSGEEN